MNARLILRTALLPIALVVGSGAAAAETSLPILIGVSTPLTGKGAAYGTELERGLQLGFAELNAAGGVGGRKVELLVRDDEGRAEQAATNTRALIEAGAIALTGYYGLPAIEAALPMAERSGIPMLGIASSAEMLREPVRPMVFNLQAGAQEEAAAIVLQLDTVGLTEISGIAQEDSLGEAALNGFQFEITRLAIRPQALVRLPADPSTAAVRQAVQQACARHPQALMLGLNASNALAVIRTARKAGCMPQFYAMSEAGVEMLASAASPGELSGVIVAQVIPHPRNARVPVAADYQRLVGAAGTYGGLEGFIYARVIAEVLSRCGRAAHPKCLVSALEKRPIDAGGYRVQFTPDNHRGSRFVEMTIVTSDGRFRR
jgi:branched-chain amino acid transport system substrate-binding protein